MIAAEDYGQCCSSPVYVQLLQKVEERLGAEAKESISGKDFLPLGPDLQASVKRDVAAVKNYKAIPDDTPVHGFIYDVKTGALEPVETS